VQRLLSRVIGEEAAATHAGIITRQYGSSGAAVESKPEDLAAVSGLSMRAAQLLCLLPSLSRRCLLESFGKSPILADYKITAEYAKALFIGARCEQFYMLCLDKARRLTGCRLIRQGTAGETAFDLRSITETALRLAARAVIFIHNHPSEVSAFSISDIASTRSAIPLLNALNIPLLDHFIVAGSDVVSLRGKRLISEEEWPAEPVILPR
jgi:DNA repair protein RadC